MKTLTILLLLGAVMAPLAHAREVAVECRAFGFKTAQSGRTLYTEARLQFALEGFRKNATVVQLSDLRGTIKIGSDRKEPLNKDNAYIGHFRFRGLASDPTYVPRKYEGYVKFAKFDAIETTGMESGMWGNLLLSRELDSAKYVFQAGDHMGGTIHFTCRASE